MNTLIQRRFMIGMCLCLALIVGTLMVASRAYADCTATPASVVDCDSNNNPNGNVNNTGNTTDVTVNNDGVTGNINNDTSSGDAEVNNDGTAGTITNNTDSGNATVYNDGTSDTISNTASDGFAGVDNTGTSGDIDNAAFGGDAAVINDGTTEDIINTSTNSTGTYTVAIIVNAGTTGDIDNAAFGGDAVILNCGTIGDIINTSVDGVAYIENCNTTGDIDNLSTDGASVVINDGATGDITNTAVDGDAYVENYGDAGLITNMAVGCGDAEVYHAGTADGIDNTACAGGGVATITINGVVNGDVYNLGSGAGNQVILENGAVITGIIDGGVNVPGSGDDTLVFTFTVDMEDYEALAQQIANASPGGGTITINGRTYTWQNFTQLRNLLQKLFMCFKDDRLNNCDPEQTAALYCAAGGGLNVWDVNDSKGTPSLEISKQQIADGIAKAKNSKQNVLIADNNGRQVWALESGELQMHDSRAPELHGAPYDFIFEGQRCG